MQCNVMQLIDCKSLSFTPPACRLCSEARATSNLPQAIGNRSTACSGWIDSYRVVVKARGISISMQQNKVLLYICIECRVGRTPPRCRPIDFHVDRWKFGSDLLISDRGSGKVGSVGWIRVTGWRKLQLMLDRYGILYTPFPLAMLYTLPCATVCKQHLGLGFNVKYHCAHTYTKVVEAILEHELVVYHATYRRFCVGNIPRVPLAGTMCLLDR